MSNQLVLALDVGGSSVKSALVANGQHILGSVCVDEIQSDASATEILHRFAAIISNHLERESYVTRLAFAFPGPFDYEQGISLIQGQAKYDGLYRLNVGTKLKEMLALPALEMRYRNDAEAAILGEALYGAGVPYDRLLGVTLGTGLGSAFVAEGNIITQGEDVPQHGWLYSCMVGNQRADDVFSTRGLLARLRTRGIQVADLADLVHVSKEQAVEDALHSFGTDLGMFLKPFVSNFRAESVLVTGGIAESWERFSPSLRYSLPVPPLKGTLGSRAALFGAAALYS